MLSKTIPLKSQNRGCIERSH